MVVASIKKGNKPFNEVTLAGMIMATCPIVWRGKYNLTYKTIPKSPRTIPQDLENITKVYVKKYNVKAKANKAKIATASKAGEACVPRKRTNGGSSDQVPKKGHSVGARLMEGHI
jgi:hypothetical protein